MQRLVLPWRLTLFILLSFADLLLTMWLLTAKGGRVYESNPVAGWILESFSWPGLVAFKSACVLVAVAALIAIARQRPRTAGLVLVLGCMALAATVLWSGKLALATDPSYKPITVLTEVPQRRLPPPPPDGGPRVGIGAEPIVGANWQFFATSQERRPRLAQTLCTRETRLHRALIVK